MPKNKELEEDSQNSEEQGEAEGTSEGESPEEGGTEEYSDSEKQLHARATKAEKRLKEFEAQNEKLRGFLSNEEDDSDKEEEPSPSVVNAREYARLLNEGYSDSEIDFVEKVMKTEGMKAAKDALEKEWVKTSIESLRQQREVEESVPSPSEASRPEFKGKKFHELDEGEKKEAFEELIGKYSGGGEEANI